MSKRAHSYLVSVGNRFLTGSPDAGFTWKGTNANDAYRFSTYDEAMEALKEADLSGMSGEVSIIRITVEEIRLGAVKKKKSLTFNGGMILWMTEVMKKSGEFPPQIMVAGDHLVMRYTGSLGELYIPVPASAAAEGGVEIIWIEGDGAKTERHSFMMPTSPDAIADVIRGFFLEQKAANDR